ncbi:hypothetical protein [Vibrio sp. CK2-1]|uniref:hypothetical protein n=1 Tax=Vibrio sp. CK2-1 TaxID=2912249 RepID=UPI001F21EF52|nr:hypothetical protein [Vibrio sp. CK2-1]MCF7354023.1 hypothetical protein [Vibrio sp. CK2-1]
MIYKESTMKTTQSVFMSLWAASCLMLVGCANDKPLGVSVAQVQQQQVYNPNASEENKDVIPTGTGARSQVAYDVYSGQTEQGISGTLLESLTTDE